ncbi:hypothetical protein [Mycolicibacterium tokaiense]|uniref:Uncharacterized protein n=1 Tax=Mycolicibacterium tokaiense TaxID=39695 RepID=A0A378TI74_9MYCO|nr:hypothetical protein [Mycolicibacterium tokaiense]BBY84982.1 hypothetical protein MTOK_07640 [Mycolicibacterium tokaiense]STZ60512.1 Uncharacterised protein [Mycolicibacterium tokaiense]
MSPAAERRTSEVNGAGILASQGLLSADDYTLASSTASFDDGGKYRLEISGVERLSTLEVLLDEAAKQDVFIHRIIAFGGGTTLLNTSELRDVGTLAAENGIELIAVPGPRTGWDTGRQALSTEGQAGGRRVRGLDNIRYLLDDYLRIFSTGIRGVLVWDEGVLDILNKARDAGHIPADAKFKISVYAGHANPASIKILQELGADSVNPVGDLSRPMLGAIRRNVDVPLDVWAETFESFGGMNRLWEAGDIARVAGPVYFKIEPGESEAVMYNGWVRPEFHEELIRHKVRHAAILNELVATSTPDVAVSPRPRLAATALTN